MDWISGLQRALDYVDEHITEPIDYEKVAKEAYSSSFHFQRVFSAIFGYSLGDYIRFRRLSLAGNELVTTSLKVIDAALKYGYDTPESFSRAFTRFHGVSPSAAKRGANLKSFSKLSVKLILHGGTTMGYRIEKKEAFDVILRKKRFPKAHEITTREIAKFWGECQTDGTVAAHTYAVFKCVGKMPESFQKVYKYICMEFFPASGYKPCGIEIESYPSADIQNADYTCEIWIAVEKK